METTEQQTFTSQLRTFEEKLRSLCKEPDGFSDNKLMLLLKRELSSLNDYTERTRYAGLTLLNFVNPIFRAAHENKQGIRPIDIEHALLAYERKRDDILKPRNQIRVGEEGQVKSVLVAPEDARTAGRTPLQQQVKQLSAREENDQEPLQKQSAQPAASERHATRKGPPQLDGTATTAEGSDRRLQSSFTSIPTATAASDGPRPIAAAASSQRGAPGAQPPLAATVLSTQEGALQAASTPSLKRHDVNSKTTPAPGIQHANPNSNGTALAASTTQPAQVKDTRPSLKSSKQHGQIRVEEPKLPSQHAGRGPFLAPPARSRSSRRYSSSSSNDNRPAVDSLSLPNGAHLGKDKQQLRGILKPMRKTATFASPVVQETLRRDGDSSPTPEDIVSVKQEMEELNITDPRQGLELLKQHRAFKDTRQPSARTTRHDEEAPGSEEEFDESGKSKPLRPRRAVSTDIDLQHNVPSGYEDAEQDWPSPADIGDQEDDQTFDPDEPDAFQEDEGHLGSEGETEQETENEEVDRENEAAYKERGRSRKPSDKAAYAHRRRSVSTQRRSRSPPRRRARSKTPARLRQPEDIRVVQGVAGKGFRTHDRIVYVAEACGSCFGGEYDCYVWLVPLTRLTCVRCYLRNKVCNFVKDSKKGIMTHPSKYVYDAGEVIAPLEGVSSPVMKRIASRSPASSRQPPKKKQLTVRVPPRSQSRGRSLSVVASENGTIRGFRRTDGDPEESGDNNYPNDFESMHCEQDEQDHFDALRSEQGEVLSTIAQITSDLNELRQESKSLRTWVESHFVHSAKKGKKKQGLVAKEIAMLADAATKMGNAVAGQQQQLNEVLQLLTSGCDAVLAEMVSAVQPRYPAALPPLPVKSGPVSSSARSDRMHCDDPTDESSEAATTSPHAAGLTGHSPAKQYVTQRDDAEEAVDWNNSDDDNYAADAPILADDTPPHLMDSTPSVPQFSEPGAPDPEPDCPTRSRMGEGPSANGDASSQAVEDVMFNEYIWADGEGSRQENGADLGDGLPTSASALIPVQLRTSEGVVGIVEGMSSSPLAAVADKVPMAAPEKDVGSGAVAVTGDVTAKGAVVAKCAVAAEGVVSATSAVAATGAVAALDAVAAMGPIAATGAVAALDAVAAVGPVAATSAVAATGELPVRAYVAMTDAVPSYITAGQDMAMAVDVLPQRLGSESASGPEADVQMPEVGPPADISAFTVPSVPETFTSIPGAAAAHSALPPAVNVVRSATAMDTAAVITALVAVGEISNDFLTPVPADGLNSMPFRTSLPVNPRADHVTNVSFVDAAQGPLVTPESSQESPQSSTTLHSQDTSTIPSNPEDVEMSNGEAIQDTIPDTPVVAESSAADSSAVENVGNAAQDLADNGRSNLCSTSPPSSLSNNLNLQADHIDSCDLGPTPLPTPDTAVGNTGDDHSLQAAPPSTTTTADTDKATAPTEVVVPSTPIVLPPSSPLTSLSSQQGDLPSPLPVGVQQCRRIPSPQLRVVTRSRSVTPGVTTRSRSNSKVLERPKPSKPSSKSRTPSKKH